MFKDWFQEWRCLECGTVDFPKTYTRGSFLTELMLWLFFILPGVVYSIWRGSTKYRGCPRCGSTRIIPNDTPAAQAQS